MIAKATEFGDQETIVKIKTETDPIKMKRLGKTVKNYNNRHWLSVAEERIMPGLTAKFSQNSHLKQVLLSTQDNILLEAKQNLGGWEAFEEQ